MLEYIIALMSWCGTRSIESGCTKSRNSFFTSFGTWYILFYQIGFVIISTAVFAYKQWPQYEMLLGPCFVVIAGMQSSGMFICFGLNMSTINVVNQKIEAIVMKGMNKYLLNEYAYEFQFFFLHL